MKRLILFLLLAFSYSIAFGQGKAYIIYNTKGKKISFKKMLKKLAKTDFILFGELHNDPISHWMEYEITAELGKRNKLILGAEMIEADNQLMLNDYLEGDIDYEGLDSLARLWPNYRTDYEPLVNYAKENEIDFVASNIPRRYAHMIYRGGFEVIDTLSEKEKSWIAPFPIPFDSELPRYKNILSMMGEHGTPKLVKAQASKDATMAHFILDNYKVGYQFIHYNGSYHSDYFEGIYWYLTQKIDKNRIRTISTVSQVDVSKLENEFKGSADFIICVDSNMTKTYYSSE